MTRKCINCGKPIAKKTHTVRIEPTRPYRPATTKMLMGREVPDMSEQQEKPEGHREVGEFSTTIYTDNPPKTKADCQRFVNGEVVSVKRHWKRRRRSTSSPIGTASPMRMSSSITAGALSASPIGRPAPEFVSRRLARGKSC
jgi:hypothetical protein